VIESPGNVSCAAANCLQSDYFNCSNLVMEYCAVIFNLHCDTTQTTTRGQFSHVFSGDMIKIIE
jgi:hypothetical protein